MVFSSLLFTFFFLPVVLILHYLAKPAYRNYLLLAASLLFYAYGEPVFVAVMIAMILINYGFALFIDRVKEKASSARVLLWLCVFTDIGLLFVYKYLGFTYSILNRLFHTSLYSDIALPIGISFFTFQAMSYVIDVYRGTTGVQKNPFYVALYISFFPQLIAGPIVRYNTIAEQIEHRTCTPEKFADGARRFLLGFCKKVILANNLSVISAQVFSLTDVRGAVTTPMLWLGAIAYTLQIYYDFSGYSDMAIGLGKLFGFRFEENFNYPYICSSITDFWRRWHISLSTWFRDYVYIPLGGSRVQLPRQILNLFVVWLLTGIWHGANWTFIAWGLWYFVLLVIEKLLVKPDDKPLVFRLLWRIVSLVCVVLAWVMFNSGAFSVGLNYCRGMFGFYETLPPGAEAPQACMPLVYYLREYGAYLVMGILFATPVMPYLAKKIDGTGAGLKNLRGILSPFAYGFVFLWAVSFLILGVHNPFIYFNF